MRNGQELIVGIDAGTSVMKAVAFTLDGRQMASASIRNAYASGEDGSATQPLDRTWSDCAAAVRKLSEKIEGLPERVVAVGVTGQGDGTWLIDAAGDPVTDAWLWLDARAAPTVERLAATEADRPRFEATGTGLNTCQQGSQLAHMKAHYPEILARTATAFHCKDWLYFKLTGERVTRGAQAATLHADGGVHEASPPRVEVVDTVGAGDASIGGMLFSLMAAPQRTWPEHLAFALAAGAAACRHTGAHAPTLDEVVALLER